jgi:hypothetical protein
MRIFKSHPFLKMVNSYVIDSPQPSNLSYLWNFGSLLAFCLVIQIATGVTLAMHYNPSVLEAFNSVEHIMRDVNNGWLIRYLHSNTASAFFFLVYLHIGRGLYYGSYRAPRTLVWTIGTIIFVTMMATAFLGYIISSPKWHELLLIFNIYFCIINIYLILFSLSCIFFYLDNFKFSNVNIIKNIQIFSFISIPFVIILFTYNLILSTDIINYVNDNENNVNLHGNISFDKEAGKAIGQGLNTIGSQLGLGGTMVGIGTAVSKTVAKGGMPPLQKEKAGLVVGTSLIAGLGHSLISSANRGAVKAENISSVPSNNITSHLNKLIDDSSVSPLQDLLFNGEMMSYVCLGILYILILQFIFKLHIKNNINLDLERLLGNNINTKINFYFNKIIKLNKQMNVIWIWIGFSTILFGLGTETYALYKLLNNLNNFIYGHISFNPDINNNIYTTHIYSKSIKDILLNLQAINYIAIIVILFIMLQVILKFNYNKNINNIYIWLGLFILILIISFSAYLYGDLYVNLNNYVNNYINIIKK